MEVFEKNKGYKIINGSNLDVLETIAENSIDAVITDPPYELGFMGKKWDSTGKAVAFENRERNKDYKYIGIELEKEYCEISEMRIDYAINKYEYDLEKELDEKHKQGKVELFEFNFE